MKNIIISIIARIILVIGVPKWLHEKHEIDDFLEG
jgi:hypothetical protein